MTSEPLVVIDNLHISGGGGCTTSTNCVVYVNFTKLSELSIRVYFEFNANKFDE